MSESKLLPVVEAEAVRADFAVRRLQKGSTADEVALTALAAKRTRILENYDDGLYDKPVRDARLAEVADEESKLSSRRWIRRITIPPDISDGDPAKVNAHLRRIFERVTIDMSEPALRGPSGWVPTLEFEWRDRSLRLDGTER